MKFKISKFDRMVGIFTILGIAGFLILIFITGTTQKWFVKKLRYYTFFGTASGISQGMDLTYKGFSIGKVRKLTLDGHMVRADYYILGKYENYIKEGSLVQLITSPIGLGSSFVFHPGRGENLLPANSEIYRHDSRRGQEILDKKLNFIHDQSDSIGLLMGKVSLLIDNVNKILFQLNEAFQGSGKGELNEIVQNVSGILENVEKITSFDENSEENPGIIYNILGEDFYKNLSQVIDNLNSVTGNASTLVTNISPEVQSLLLVLRSTLVQVQDVLTGLKNNPLIKNGVPERSQSSAASEFQRGTDF